MLLPHPPLLRPLQWGPQPSPWGNQTVLGSSSAHPPCSLPAAAEFRLLCVPPPFLCSQVHVLLCTAESAGRPPRLDPAGPPRWEVLRVRLQQLRGPREVSRLCQHDPQSSATLSGQGALQGGRAGQEQPRSEGGVSLPAVPVTGNSGWGVLSLPWEISCTGSQGHGVRRYTWFPEAPFPMLETQPRSMWSLWGWSET